MNLKLSTNNQNEEKYVDAAKIDTEPAANDGYYLTPGKARDKRRIAAVIAKNEANARVFRVEGDYMTVRQIADKIRSSHGAVSKEIKRLRSRGLTRFTLMDFSGLKNRLAANDDLAGESA